MTERKNQKELGNSFSSCPNPMAEESSFSFSDPPPRLFSPPSPYPFLIFPPSDLDGKKPVFFDITSRPSTSSSDFPTAESSTSPHDLKKKRKTAKKMKKKGRDYKLKKEIGDRRSASSSGSNNFVDYTHSSLTMNNRANDDDEVPVPPVLRQPFSYDESDDDVNSLLLYQEEHGRKGRVNIRRSNANAASLAKWFSYDEIAGEEDAFIVFG